jgi:hypothetical protein
VQQLSPPIQAQPLLTDTFSDNRAAGKTIGTKSDSGAVRQGIDVEGLIAIDNGALRMQPLLDPGWGRQGIVYGPYSRTNGLTFAVSMLNGHNTSQASNIGERFRSRLQRWLLGSEANPPLERLIFWIKSKQKKGILRRFFWWLLISPRFYKLPNINENLAVGWFPTKVPQDPLCEGNSFIVHAAEGENGELWTRVGKNLLSAFRRLQNLHVYYIVVLREKGAAYYAASVPNAYGVGAFPNMRPIAIDPFNDEPTLYAGFYQCVLGQIGFRVDTRVYGVHIEQIPQLMTWYGTAHAADLLVGEGSLNLSKAEIGGYWTVYRGKYELTPKGVQATVANSLAVLDPGSPSGLVHGLIETFNDNSPVGFLWRFQDTDNFWLLQISVDCCVLQINQAGVLETVAVDQQTVLTPNQTHSIQILDDGDMMSLYLDGVRLFNRGFIDTRLTDATGVGVSGVNPSSVFIRSFEAHPRSIPIPNSINFNPPWCKKGHKIILTESFEGEHQDLAEKLSTTGNKKWQKTIGKGTFELTGQGSVKVRASVENPNPGRTAYTIAWDNPDFADIQTTIIPPGTGRDRGEKSRCGLIFWQDKDNYLTFTAYLDDAYNGASIALFSHLDGFEELYDAVWTMVWKKIYWGKPWRCRIVFDGMHFMVYLDNEPVMYRTLRDLYPNQQPLQIHRVGIVVNWEWGNDTGSVFKDFVAKV